MVINVGKVLEKIREFEHRYPGGLCWRIRSHAKVVENYLDDDEEILIAFGAQKNESFFEIFNSFVFALPCDSPRYLLPLYQQVIYYE